MRVTKERIERARDAYRVCRLCPRDCGADRTAGPTGTFCRLGTEGYVYKQLLSFGEEAELVPTWLIDLGGCSLRCLFCTEWGHVNEPDAAPAISLKPEWFSALVRRRKLQGARTVSFVGGDPTVSLLAVLEALGGVPDIDWLPVVWNCNGLMSDAALDLLDGVVASYVVDLKFGNDDCAARLAAGAGVHKRSELERTLNAAAAQGKKRPESEHFLPPLIVRHLVMPGHVDCCTKPTLDWLAADYPDAVVNVMTRYVPGGPAAEQSFVTAPSLGRLATEDERNAAVDMARNRPLRLLIDGHAA